MWSHMMQVGGTLIVDKVFYHNMVYNLNSATITLYFIKKIYFNGFQEVSID